MKVTDLTHSMHSNMPVFPGTEQPKIERVYTVEKNGFQESGLRMYSHIGTHIDAPGHMLQNGRYLENFPIDHFLGNGTILDFSDEKQKVIHVDRVRPYEGKIKKVEFVIIKTGWDKYWGEPQYYEDFPALSEEAAQYLSTFKLKGIGIDAISIDDIKSKTFAIHKIVMPKNIIIIENLTNLDGVTQEYFCLSVLPFKYENADGSPVRAVAIEEW